MLKYAIHAILILVISMNNIPVYFSKGGTATLILREVSFTGTAYVVVRTVFPGGLSELIEDCGAFCRECGATKCYLAMEDGSETDLLPHSYDIYSMKGSKALFPAAPAPFRLEAMTRDNDRLYLDLYNRCFAGVTHALTYDHGQLQRIHRTGQRAFIVYDEAGLPCGMGELHDNQLAAVGLLPEYRGKGRSLPLTLQLLSYCPGDTITLTVVSDNEAAIALYENLSFRITAIESRWYRVF